MNFERVTDRLDTIAHFLFQDTFDTRVRRTQVFVVLLAKVHEKEILRTSESTLRGIGYGSVRVKEGHLLSISYSSAPAGQVQRLEDDSQRC